METKLVKKGGYEMYKKITIAVVCLVLTLASTCFARYDSYTYEYMNTEGVLYTDIINRMIALKDILGLSDDQVGKLNELSLKMEKQHLKDLSDIGIKDNKLTEVLKKYKVEDKKVDKFVKELYELKRRQKENMVKGYVEARDIVTEKQFNHIQAILRSEYMRPKGSDGKGDLGRHKESSHEPPEYHDRGPESVDESDCSTHYSNDEKKAGKKCEYNDEFVGDESGVHGDGSGTSCSRGLKKLEELKKTEEVEK